MGYLLQTIGSVVVGGLILLLVIQYNSGIMSNSTANSVEAITQSNLIETTNIIESDFRNIGFGITGTKITSVDTLSIGFLTDINGDNVPDRIRYYFDPAGVSGTSNPNDVYLYREVNGVRSIIGEGVTRFRIYTYDKHCIYTVIPSNINIIVFELAVESTSQYYDKYTGKNVYAGGFVSKMIRPKNL